MKVRKLNILNETLKRVPEKEITRFYSEKKLIEKYQVLLNFEGIFIADANHALERFKQRFPKLSINRFYEVLKRGLRKINKRYDLNSISDENFMIVSWKYGFKLPLHIRPDEFDRSKMVGILTTTLDVGEHTFNLYNEIEILVEKSKHENFYACRNEVAEWEDLEESHFWHHFIEDGVYYRDFNLIEADED